MEIIERAHRVGCCMVVARACVPTQIFIRHHLSTSTARESKRERERSMTKLFNGLIRHKKILSQDAAARPQ